MLNALLISAHEAYAGSHIEILRIGPLRTMCFTTPCPPYNAMAISEGAEMPGHHPLHLGPLPSLRGSKTATVRVARAWGKKDCVIIRGTLNRSGKTLILFMERILRSC